MAASLLPAVPVRAAQEGALTSAVEEASEEAEEEAAETDRNAENDVESEVNAGTTVYMEKQLRLQEDAPREPEAALN